MKIEKLFIGVIAALVFYLFMQNFLGVVATKWIIQGLIIMAIFGGISWLGFQGYAIVRERILNIELLKTSVIRNQYLVHDTDSALAIDTSSGIMQFFTKSRPPKSLPAIETEVMPEIIEEPLKPVLPLINKSLIVCLYGAQDAGKTTLLCHVIESRRNEPALILDPHGYAGKYPHGEMKGIGRNYDEIESCMKWAISEVNARYQTYKGQSYSPLTIYVDELTLLSDFCPSFKQFMKVMTTESRKIGIRLVFCVHSNRAEIIGLKGNYDLADGMLFVSLFNDNGNRYAEVKKQVYELPGVYQVAPLHTATPRYTGFSECHRSTASPDFSSGAGGVSGVSGAGCMSIGMQDFSDLTDEESKVIRNYRKTGTLNKTIQSVWKSKNTTTLSKCKAILNKFGLL